MKHAAATLGSGNLRMAVKLPDGEDLNEWVAVNSECLAMLIYDRLMLHTKGLGIVIRLYFTKSSKSMIVDTLKY